MNALILFSVASGLISLSLIGVVVLALFGTRSELTKGAMTALTFVIQSIVVAMVFLMGGIQV